MVESLEIWKIKLKFQNCHANLKGIWKLKSVNFRLRTHRKNNREWQEKLRYLFYCGRILKIGYISQHLFLKKIND